MSKEFCLINHLFLHLTRPQQTTNFLETANINVKATGFSYLVNLIPVVFIIGISTIVFRWEGIARIYIILLEKRYDSIFCLTGKSFSTCIGYKKTVMQLVPSVL